MVEWEQVRTWLTTVLVGAGGGAAVAVGIFRFLGSKWLENKFARNLQEHKHAQDKELQKLRGEIDSMLSGVLKLQEREFQVLPELWEKIHDAYSKTMWFISSLQSYTDLDKLSPEELEEFLTNSWLRETQKEAIRTSTTKLNVYQDFYFWHQYKISLDAIKELQLYANKNGIFFPKNIFENTENLYKKLISLSTKKESAHRHETDRAESEAFYNEKEFTGKVYSELKEFITTQLRSHTQR